MGDIIHLIDGQKVEVLDNEVEDEPVAQLLEVGQGHRLKDRHNLSPADGFAALELNK